MLFVQVLSLAREMEEGPTDTSVLEVFTEGMQLEIYLVALRPLQRRLLSVREAEKGSNDTDGGPSSYPGQR